MATSMTVSTTNKLAKQNHRSDTSLDTLYDELQKVFAQNCFNTFEQKCKQLASTLDNYPIPVYSSVQFDSTKHKITSTTAKDYLHHLLDGDPNFDLTSLKPVQISNDNNVLFRAVASLLGISCEKKVRELKLRCLVDAVSNLKKYIDDYKDILKPLLEPDKSTIACWANFVRDRARMDTPDVITVLILITLAKIINIPIRSVHSPLSKYELDENPDNTYKLLNRVFDPPFNQREDTETKPKPITILWWCTEPSKATIPDHVIPLFRTPEQDMQDWVYVTAPTKSDIAISSTIDSKSLTVQRCGSLILIDTDVSNYKANQTHKRIKEMKATITELMKIIADMALSEDIIEVNICDQKLRGPPLIPFCKAADIASENNLKLINAIEFREFTHHNHLFCVSAARDRLARQQIYYPYLFQFSVENDTDKSIARTLRQSRSINSQIITSPEQLKEQKEHFESLNISRANYLHRHNNDSRNQASNNETRREITIHYGSNHASQQIEKSKSAICSGPYTEVSPVRVHTKIKYEKEESLMDAKATRREEKPVRLSGSNISESNQVVASGNKYRVPSSKSSGIRFSVGFGTRKS